MPIIQHCRPLTVFPCNFLHFLNEDIGPAITKALPFDVRLQHNTSMLNDQLPLQKSENDNAVEPITLAAAGKLANSQK